MPDIIQLLPDAVANQIAAGEVVQRPASAVKELLENAVDAKAKTISLIIKNAGKTLIQVIDNGTGMTATDARLCIERHATSKIKKVEDLFALRTMGFRGEAVPSIAAVSQTEIKTKTHQNELGTQLILDGSEVVSQEVVQTPVGTNICVKNLFFNIPARRNFLKSNPVETKHIIEEFVRISMIHPEIAMSLVNDENEVFRLPTSSFRQRIVNLYGSKYDLRLVPVEETTDIVSVNGFIGKPEYAKKTRGEQFFFVNERFIKSPYLNHAIQKAYEELLPKDQFPSYFLKLEINPAKIDINIHPTKTEIKFEEERSIYAIIRTAVRQALGKYNIAPSIDFDQENSFNVPALKKGEAIQIPNIQVNQEFNPFNAATKEKQNTISFPFERAKINKQWGQLYQKEIESPPTEKESAVDITFEQRKVFQLHNKYLLSHIRSGFVVVHQRRAHERILIEKLSAQFQQDNVHSQQLLFPEDITLNSDDSVLITSLLDELNKLGFDIRSFGKNHFIIHGIPTESNGQSGSDLIEKMLEEFKQNLSDLKNSPRINMIRALARSMSIKPNKKLNQEEMIHLIDELFACEMPQNLPNGKAIFVNFSLEDLDKKFNK